MANAGVVLNSLSSSSYCSTVNELVCVVQFYFPRYDKDYVAEHLSDFYSAEEIVSSKNVLFTAAARAGFDSAPQQVSRLSANRKPADMYDIVS